MIIIDNWEFTVDHIRPTTGNEILNRATKEKLNLILFGLSKGVIRQKISVIIRSQHLLVNFEVTHCQE